MLCFLDTSALVKRYRQEIGTEVLEQLFKDPSNIFVMSAFSLLESARTLDRHRQSGELSEGDVRLAMARLAKDCHSQRVELIDIQRTHLAQASVSYILAERVRHPASFVGNPNSLMQRIEVVPAQEMLGLR